MAGGAACQNPSHKDHWSVSQYKQNRSVFNGRRVTPSDYSEVLCTATADLGPCSPSMPGVHWSRWRSRAAYVENLPRSEAQAPAAATTTDELELKRASFLNRGFTEHPAHELYRVGTRVANSVNRSKLATVTSVLVRVLNGGPRPYVVLIVEPDVQLTDRYTVWYPQETVPAAATRP